MRLKEIQVNLAKAGQVMALAPGDDFRYAVGWSPMADERLTFLIIGPRTAHLVIASVNAEEAVEHLPKEVSISRFTDDTGPQDVLSRAVALQPTLPWLISDDARYDHGGSLTEAVGQSMGLASQVMAPLRMKKDDGECRLLQACQSINDLAMQAGLEALRPGLTELELADVIRQSFIRNGADREAFIIVAFGEHTALPHHSPTTTVIGEGPVLLDIGCYYQGYASDMTRVAYIGEPPEEFRLIHGLVDQAVRAAQQVAVPGAPAEVVDQAARGFISSAGYGAAFIHRVGHGIGLSVHEPPSVAEGNTLKLPENAAFSIEPGIYLPGQFGVRLEEVVINRSDGASILSKIPRDIYVKPLS